MWAHIVLSYRLQCCRSIQIASRHPMQYPLCVKPFTRFFFSLSPRCCRWPDILDLHVILYAKWKSTHDFLHTVYNLNESVLQSSYRNVLSFCTFFVDSIIGGNRDFVLFFSTTLHDVNSEKRTQKMSGKQNRREKNIEKMPNRTRRSERTRVEKRMHWAFCSSFDFGFACVQ